MDGLKPLGGIQVVVTRATRDSNELRSRLQELGATVLLFPTVEFASPINMLPLDTALRNLGSYHWIVFTSTNGVRFFFGRLGQLNLTGGIGASTRVAAVGPSTAKELTSRGVRVDFIPNRYLTDEVAYSLPGVSERRILLPRSDLARKDLADTLRSRGGIVDDVVAYRTVIPETIDRVVTQSILAGTVDLLLFTSPSTVENFVTILGDSLKSSLKIQVACIGPVTAEAVRRVGLPVTIVSKEHTVAGLVEALVREVGKVEQYTK